MNGEKKTAWAIGALVVACTLWGSTFVLGKIALAELTVSQIIVYRFGLTALLLLPFAIRRGIWPRSSDLPVFLLAALFGVPLTFLLQFGGLERTSAVHAALIVGSMPLLLALAAVTFDGERMSSVGWAAIALSTIGVALVVGLPSGSGGDWVGNAMVLLSLLAAVVWVLLNKQLLARYRPVGSTGYIAMLGTLMLLPVTLWRDGGLPVSLSPGVWAAVVGLGALCTALSFTLWNWALEHVETSRAGVFVNLEPVVGAALGMAVMGESLGTTGLFGGAMILASALLVSLPGAVRPSPARV